MKIITLIVVLLSLVVTYYAGAVQGHARAFNGPAVKLHWI
jgi:hypothetical protein